MFVLLFVNCFQFCLQFMPHSVMRLCLRSAKETVHRTHRTRFVLPEGVSAKQWSVQLVKHAIAHSLHSLPIESIEILYNCYICYCLSKEIIPSRRNPKILPRFLKHFKICEISPLTYWKNKVKEDKS
jgi:hypothetical protein